MQVISLNYKTTMHARRTSVLPSNYFLWQSSSKTTCYLVIWSSLKGISLWLWPQCSAPITTLFPHIHFKSFLWCNDDAVFFHKKANSSQFCHVIIDFQYNYNRYLGLRIMRWWNFIWQEWPLMAMFMILHSAGNWSYSCREHTIQL